MSANAIEKKIKKNYLDRRGRICGRGLEVYRRGLRVLPNAKNLSRQGEPEGRNAGSGESNANIFRRTSKPGKVRGAKQVFSALFRSTVKGVIGERGERWNGRH